MPDTQMNVNVKIKTNMKIYKLQKGYATEAQLIAVTNMQTDCQIAKTYCFCNKV